VSCAVHMVQLNSITYCLFEGGPVFSRISRLSAHVYVHCAILQAQYCYAVSSYQAIKDRQSIILISPKIKLSPFT